MYVIIVATQTFYRFVFNLAGAFHCQSKLPVKGLLKVLGGGGVHTIAVAFDDLISTNFAIGNQQAKRLGRKYKNTSKF